MGNIPNWTISTGYLMYFRVKLDQARSSHCASTAAATRIIPEAADLSEVWNYAWQHITSNFPLGQSAVNDQVLHIAALKALSRLVRAGHIFATFGITTFAWLDVREGPFGNWERHLRGARAILDIHCNDCAQFADLCESTPGLRQAISLLIWYDVMGCVINQDRSLIFDRWHREYMHESLFELTGCSRETFQLYVDIARKHTSSDPHRSYNLTLIQLLDLTHANDEEPQSILSDVWRLGAVLATISCLQPGEETICIIADKICSLVENMDQDHVFYLHLACGVYLIGVHGTTQRHQTIVQQYWSYFDSRAVPEYPHARELCAKARLKRLGLL